MLLKREPLTTEGLPLRKERCSVLFFSSSFLFLSLNPTVSFFAFEPPGVLVVRSKKAFVFFSFFCGFEKLLENKCLPRASSFSKKKRFFSLSEEAASGSSETNHCGSFRSPHKSSSCPKKIALLVSEEAVLQKKSGSFLLILLEEPLLFLKQTRVQRTILFYEEGFFKKSEEWFKRRCVSEQLQEAKKRSFCFRKEAVLLLWFFLF